RKLRIDLHDHARLVEPSYHSVDVAEAIDKPLARNGRTINTRDAGLFVEDEHIGPRARPRQQWPRLSVDAGAVASWGARRRLDADRKAKIRITRRQHQDFGPAPPRWYPDTRIDAADENRYLDRALNR